MEQIYPGHLEKCKLVKAKPATVEFLLQYSKALHVTKHKGIILENNLN